jgi:hypothetical protein
MRELHEKEIRKNGCPFCLDMVRKRTDGQFRRCCPYDRCPYRELGEFKTYQDYIKSKGGLKWLSQK